MNLKKLMWVFLLAIIIISSLFLIINVGNDEDKNNRINIVVSNFASYDFLRAIIGNDDTINLELLIDPGKDFHSYDPTSKDLIKIKNSDLYVYVGGEVELWADKVLETIDTNNTKVICVADDIKVKKSTVEVLEEHNHEDGHEHDEDGAFDEHIWTSPENAIIMINTFEKVMEEIDPLNKEKYILNAQNYINKIEKLDEEFQLIVDNRVRDKLVFGDKMPMQYFIEYYGLEVSAAFNGCSTETEPSSKVISNLVDIIIENEIPVVLYIELSTGKTAKMISEEVENKSDNICEAMQIQTIHNVSKDDFENGENWISLMEKNLEVLKKALY